MNLPCSTLWHLLCALCFTLVVTGCESSDTNSSSDTTCEFAGTTYQVGDSFDAGDGCNSCTCESDGSAACTEIACPVTECGPDDCGPALGMPNYPCEDGVTIGGPGDCELQENGQCGWTIVDCPMDPCAGISCDAGYTCEAGECVGLSCDALSCGDACAASNDECAEAYCDLSGDCVCGAIDTISCTEDLCADAECLGSEAFCEGDTAYGASTAECDPSTGECVEAPAPAPRDCGDEGLVCEDGECVYDPCSGLACGEACTICAPNDPDCIETDEIKACNSDGECVSAAPDMCMEDLCDMITCGPGYTCEDGECIYTPCADQACGTPCTVCAPDDVDCIETAEIKACNAAGQCVSEMPGMCDDLCADVVCPSTPPFCEGTWMHSGTYSECNPATGECLMAPGAPPYDCAQDGLVCVAGMCVPGDDESCVPGTNFPAEDGCNTCECPDSGLKSEAACTEMACPEPAGCQSSDDCEAGYYCDFPNNDCGVWGQLGTCAMAPMICPAGGVGACGCDGSFALNDCELAGGGTDVNDYGGCGSMEPDATFSCGTESCSIETQYCSIAMNDAMGPNEPLYYNNCAPLPDDCGQGDCSCIETGTEPWSPVCYDGGGFTMLFSPGG